MVENPMTWGRAEHVVNDALRKANDGRAQGRVGLSTVRQITDALRQAGLLKDQEDK